MFLLLYPVNLLVQYANRLILLAIASLLVPKIELVQGDIGVLLSTGDVFAGTMAAVTVIARPR